MTLANRLTMARIALAGLFFFCAVHGALWSRALALVLFIAAGLTDWLDGFVARRTKTQSAFGALADPLADKLLVTAALIAFLKIRELEIPAWIIFLTLAREFIIGSLRALAGVKGFLLSADRWGKWKMGVQTGSILAILLWLTLRSLSQVQPPFYGLISDGEALLSRSADWPLYLSYLILAATWASGGRYLYKNRRLLQESWG